MTAAILLPWHTAAFEQLKLLPEQGTAGIYLYGASGHGKRQLAMAYTAWLLCEARPRGQQACGVCAGCQLLAVGKHPDLRIIVPEALGQDVLTIDRDPEASESSGKNPSQDIRIDDIRELADFAYTASHRGGVRVVALWPAQALNTNAANALLKILEEPPSGLRFVLVGRSLNQVLPTIRSRCRLMPVNPAAASESSAWLAAGHGIGVPEAKLLLSLAGGAPVLAQSLHGSADVKTREAWLKLLSAPPSIDVFKAPAQFDGLGIAVLSELTLRLLFELQGLQQGRSMEQFEWLQTKLAWAKTLPLEALVEMQAYLFGVQRSAGHPLNSKLVIESLLNRWLLMAGY